MEIIWTKSVLLFLNLKWDCTLSVYWPWISNLSSTRSFLPRCFGPLLEQNVNKSNIFSQRYIWKLLGQNVSFCFVILKSDYVFFVCLWTLNFKLVACWAIREQNVWIVPAFAENTFWNLFGLNLSVWMEMSTASYNVKRESKLNRIGILKFCVSEINVITL